jgi:60 kDa SS-A/Ro ribonucleoprotein
MSALNKFVSTPATQTEKSRSDQVKNNAGGFVFKVSEVSRLERFLILGTDGGTYYVGEKDLTKTNVDFIRQMIQNDPGTVIKTVIDVSDKGRAYRNDAAIFVLALMLAEGPESAKPVVIEAIPKVVRIATHAYQLATFIEGLGGWGRAKRRAIAKWFESKSADQLAYQAVKYRQRNGWTLRDLMRLAHPKDVDQNVGNFILGKDATLAGEPYALPLVIAGFAIMQKAQTVNDVLAILGTYPNLPWEAIPTEFLKDKDVWAMLLTNNQLNGQALVRNVTRLAKIGAFNDMTFARMYADKLTDSDMIAKTRLHPIQYLLASVTYAEGQLKRSGHDFYSMWSSPREKSWVANSVILDALDAGFHSSFKSITPADKRTMLALDVSGSMGQDANGIDLSCAQVSAAMAMVIARTEPWHQIMGFATEFQDLGIFSRMTLPEVRSKISKARMGGTDLATPMLYAAKNKIEVDTFAIFTDNETWAGRVHPYKALQDYRQKMGIDAKLAVFGVSATEFSIADPKDTKGSMDFVGFDSTAASVFADFSAGRI